MRTRSMLIQTLAIMLMALTGAAASHAAETAQPKPESLPLPLKPGPHLFLDDYLIASSTGVQRQVNSPRRFLKEPIITGRTEHQNWQPFLTVLHDPSAAPAKRFRMWYNADAVDDPADGAYAGVTGYLESADGIHWPGPYKRLESLTFDGRPRFGASVLDDGPNCTNPAERYKMMYFDAGKMWGPRVALSPDGLNWKLLNAGKPIRDVTSSDDIFTAGWDPIRKRYFLIGKHYGPHQWTNAEGRKLSFPIRRYYTSFSQDFKTWSDPEGYVYSPDEKDSGITQWYGSAGYQVRGDLIIGFLRVLRDDKSTEGIPPQADYANKTGHAGVGDHKLGKDGGSGMGYTVLTWTRDGKTWQRDRHTDPFFEPDPKVGVWDHAMSWVGSAVPVGDELYLYYAGYKWGHKYHHSTERQIGLVKIKQDRYVARRAGKDGGQITTPVVVLEADKLTLNADASAGEIRLQVCDAAGKPIDGLSFADCQPIIADSLAAPVRWNRMSLTAVRGQPVRLAFHLQNASLFAFDLSPSQP